MSTDELKALTVRSFDVLHNDGNLNAVEEFIGNDFINRDTPAEMPGGPAGMRAVITMLRAGFPDLHITVQEMVAEGDTVVANTVFRGTHLGNFLGLPATGRPVEQEQYHVLRFRDGKVVEHRSLRDDLGMMRQLGVIPAALP